MTPAQQTALEGLVDRSLTLDEIAAIEPHLVSRNDVAIANILSVGKTKFRSRLIGVGTILEVMGDSGALFLDALVSAGAQNRTLHWAMVLINNSNLDIGKQATQDQMTALASAMPPFATGLAALKALGTEPNAIHYNAVSDVLNVAEGRMTL